MKKVRLQLIFLAALLLLPSALAQLSCSITTTAACAGVPVLKLSAATDAHASTPVPANVASHVICCTGVADLTVSYISIPNQYVTSLASTSDSHVSILVGAGAYDNKISIDSTNYALNCGGPLLPADCSTYQTCLYEVPNGGSDEHVFPCSSPGVDTRRQVCCSATLGGGGEAMPFCTDSIDGGEVYDILGTTIDYFGQDTDSCSGATLTEWRCNQATLSRESVPYVCPNGCLNGACQLGAQAGTCTDTDGGQIYTIRGTTTPITGVPVSDSCSGNILTEYWCNTDILDSEQHDCAATGGTCVDGACLAAAGGGGGGGGAGDICEDSDNGPDFFVQGTTIYNNDAGVTDTCVGTLGDPKGLLTEYSCDAANQRISQTTECPCALDGSGACAQTCIQQDIYWADEFDNQINEAVINYPVSAVIVGQGCLDFNADFTIYNEAGDEFNPDSDNIDYVQDGNTWIASGTWTPAIAGRYSFGVNSTGPPGMRPSDPASPILDVTNPCFISPDLLEVCPADWVGPQDQDLDCDGVQDCLDGWIGNAGCAIDPNNGVPVCATSCEGLAWDCSGTSFSDCFPDPENQDYYVQSRVGDCTRINKDTIPFCPPPSDLRGCIVEEDFPVFGWMNLLAVSMMLIGFYAFRRK